VPPLFRRRSAELAEDAGPPDDAAEDAAADDAAEEVTEEPEESEEARRPKGYTPSKKELGLSTPKRPSHLRRPGTTPAPRSRKDMTKEERRELKEERRARRREATEGMRRGDPKFLPARDRGPERAIARDVVDSRRTVGTWFLGGALIVLFGSSSAVPQIVVAANLLFMLLALALIVDSTVLCRKVRRLVRERHPDSTERMGSLYLYVVMRAISFRRMRIPHPRVKLGDKV
jgi:hypothetical protein